MSGIQTNSRPWLVQPLLLVLSVIACGLNVANTIRDVDQYGGTDLRIRVVGARALTRGLNPYTLSQSADTDPLLRDPDHVQLSRCTYPPTLLLFYSPFSGLSYPVQRKLWAVLEWSAFFGSVWLLSSLIHDSAARVWFWIVALGLFGGSSFWRLHVERGQYYVFVVFLLSCGYFLQRRYLYRGDMTAGFLNGIAIVLRPTAVLTAVPGLLLSPRTTAVTSLTTAMFFVLAVLQFGPPSVWSDFLRLSAQWEQALLTTTEKEVTAPEATSDAVVMNSRSAMLTAVEAEDQTDDVSDAPLNQRSSVEGVEVIDGYRVAILPGPAASLTFLSLSQSLLQGLQVDPRSEVMAISGKILCIILLTLICGLFVRQQLKIRSERSVIESDLSHGGKIPAAIASASDMLQRRFLSGICLMLTADYFLPIRVEYADILFLIPAALLMPEFLLPRNRILAMATAAAFLSHRLLLLGLPDHLASMTAMLRTFMAMYVLIRLTLFETPGQNS